jgi:hypothetical protein
MRQLLCALRRLAFLALALLAATQAAAVLITGPGTVSYQGLWWNFPADTQHGWGLNIAHQGGTLFATWFTYDSDGSGMWLVVPDAALEDMGDTAPTYGGAIESLPTYSGTLYRTNGPAFDAAPFDGTKVVPQPLGTAVFTFTSPDIGTFTFTINGVTRRLVITRENFDTPPACAMGGAPPAEPNFTDLWYNAPAESERGWGVNLTHQGNILFATWFTYDASGKAMWLVMPRGESTGPQAWSGPLYRTTGPGFDAAWDDAKVAATVVGTASFAFADASKGTFTATVNGRTVVKSITRQVYMTPPTVCR